MMNKCIGILLLGLLSLNVDSLEFSNHLKQCDYKPIELKKIPTKHDVVKAEINGVNGVFIIDTGAIKSVIDHRMMQKYKIESHMKTGSETGAGAGGVITMDSYDIESYSIDGFPLNVSNIGVIDLSSLISGLGQSTGVWVDGLIGQDVLLAHKGILELKRHQIWLHGGPVSSNCISKTSTLLNSNDYKAIPLKPLSIDLFIIDVAINGEQAVMILDSGARESIIHSKNLSSFHISSENQIRSRQSSGAGGAFQLQILPIESLVINQQKLNIQQVTSLNLSAIVDYIEQKTDVQIDGVIGQDVLEPYQAIIDMGAQVLYFKIL